MTSYSDHSTSTGALVCFLFSSSQTVDLSKSIFLALNVTSSRSYTLPNERLHAGEYRVLVYDIEQDGRFSRSISYPAVTESVTSRNDQRIGAGE